MTGLKTSYIALVEGKNADEGSIMWRKCCRRDWRGGSRATFWSDIVTQECYEEVFGDILGRKRC